MPVKSDRPVGWTGRSVAVSVLLAMEEYHRQAGQRLRALREGRGWGHEELAHQAGVSVKTVSRFENGHVESRRGTVNKLAKALSVTPQDILGEPPPVLGLGETQLDRIENAIKELEEQVRLLRAETAARDAAMLKRIDEGLPPKRRIRKQPPP